MTNPQTSYTHTLFPSHSFFASRRNVVLSTTIPHQLDMLKSTGRYTSFDLKWHPIYDDVQPDTGIPSNKHLFWDSDLGKWVETVAYFMLAGEDVDHDVLNAVDEITRRFEKAQMEDGYLNLHYQVVEPGKRFTNLRDMHELYNCGHLIEGALVLAEAGDKRLLDVMIKYVNLLVKTFGPGEGQLHGYPGHPEIELALIRLYKVTGDPKHLGLAKYFLTERGHVDKDKGVEHYYDVEAKTRGERPNERPGAWPERRAFWYQQAHKPLIEQETVEGHSVRVMYLLTAAADLALLDEKFRIDYMPALTTLWNNCVSQKMYLTGGVGSQDQWEGFGINYFLPQSTDEGGCYAETCAGIGVMMLANRMLQLDLHRKYSDILELCLFNCVLTGMSMDGKAFTYVNQLASSDGELSKRYEWFDCACCPPNMVRTLAILGGYFWDVKEIKDHASRRTGYELDFEDQAKTLVDVNVHLYNSCKLRQTLSDGSEVVLEQKTEYPWSGSVEFSLEAGDSNVQLHVRIPGWAEDYKITPALPEATVEKGYLTLPPAYLKANPRFRLLFPMFPRLIKPHPYANQAIVAVARGPLVYCIEDVDHAWVKDHFKSLVFLPSSAEKFTEVEKTDLPGDETYLAIKAEKSGMLLPQNMVDPLVDTDEPSPFFVVDDQAKKRREVEEAEKLDLTFIPYYARANRGGKGMMRVGLRRNEM